MSSNGEIIYCDYCDAEVHSSSTTGLTNWMRGTRGAIVPMSPCSGYSEGPRVKHSCGNNLCTTKLLAWARS